MELVFAHEQLVERVELRFVAKDPQRKQPVGFAVREQAPDTDASL
jgi:hypothetical protein